MPRKRKMLALPAQANKDIKTVTSILDRWAVGVEDLIKDVFAWAKKHKLLVLVTIGAVAFYRYWLAEPEDTVQTEDEDY